MYYAVTGTLIVLMAICGLVSIKEAPIMAIFFAVASICALALMIGRWVEIIEDKQE